MSDFCREHAFYDCPVCRGESLDWIIPIVKDADMFGRGGEVTGTITVSPDNVVTITGTPDLPMPSQNVIVYAPERESGPSDTLPFEETGRGVTGVSPSVTAGTGLGEEAPVPSRSRPHRPTPRQLAEVAALFSSSIMEEPWLIEAAARGRAVYARACQLAEELGLPLSTELLDRAAEES